ncbi:GNAT family N-acetyltransferase [Streptomyces sp. LHD-70]|uniref:GNAT family N-acetyltransferase n=1 Tax=Streptomyces sp. LHD-70 TaxID=3072140 RepID=UPI00280F9C8B|nr:GNAT family N-acetyltransferase [Streptomyces sp. LHD-70]MDQ8706854.1 GNAT family N-acetyltransferase [Streptomyces sp. LHD-70]
MDLKFYGHQDAAEIRTMLLDIHDAVYEDEGEDAGDAFHSTERFGGFVDRWSSRDGWVCVVGFEDGEAVGFAYGAAFSTGGWWRGSERPTSLAPEDRVFALSELMVLRRWRKTGASVALHEALIGDRPEKAVTLFVDRSHPKVQALYETWGYEQVDEAKPYEDSPTYAVMMKRLAGR